MPTKLIENRLHLHTLHTCTYIHVHTLFFLHALKYYNQTPGIIVQSHRRSVVLATGVCNADDSSDLSSLPQILQTQLLALLNRLPILKQAKYKYANQKSRILIPLGCRCDRKRRNTPCKMLHMSPQNNQLLSPVQA